MIATAMPDVVFTFAPRWKEELVCSCALGSFVLEMTMGKYSVYLPPESMWQTKAPAWARPLWQELHGQLTAWCASERMPLHVDESAMVMEA